MKSIWIIDDDQSILEVLKQFLQNEQYDVSILSSAEYVKKKMQDDIAPDVVLIDIYISGIDGRDIAKQFLEDQKFKKTHVLLMTADIHIEQKAKEARVHGYLRKPFDINELLKLIKRHLKN